MPNLHQQLDDQLVVWFDEPTRRFVFYDFEGDSGVSLSCAEWARAAAWATTIHGAPSPTC